MRWALLVLLLAGTAGAQSALPSTDPSKLGADVGALAATLLVVVQFLKRQFERQGRALVWWQTLLLTLGLGEAAAALLFYAGYGARFGSTPPPWTWLLFGAVAAASAAGLKDILSSIAERGRTTVNVPPPEGGGPVVPPPPPALEAEVVDPSRLPGFQPSTDTIEDVMRANGASWPPVIDQRY